MRARRKCAISLCTCGALDGAARRPSTAALGAVVGAFVGFAALVLLPFAFAHLVALVVAAFLFRARGRFRRAVMVSWSSVTSALPGGVAALITAPNHCGSTCNVGAIVPAVVAGAALWGAFIGLGVHALGAWLAPPRLPGES